MLKEFKDFVMRGNVMDLALAVIIGGAFGKIVTSLVNDVIMPPIGLLLGNVNFSNLFINLSATDYVSLLDAKDAGAATINYGMFLNTVIEFLIIAFVIFFLIRAMKFVTFREEKAAPAVPQTKDCPYCLSSIPARATRCAHCTSELK